MEIKRLEFYEQEQPGVQLLLPRQDEQANKACQTELKILREN